MDTAHPARRRFFYPTPGALVILSAAATGILFVSERFRLFPFNAHKGWTVLIALAGAGVVLTLLLLWFFIALIFQWSFQFGIRTLFLLTVAVSLPFSWLVVQMKKAREQKQAVKAILQEGGSVTYRYETLFQPIPRGPTRLRMLVGDDFFNDVVRATATSNTEIERLGELPELQQLWLDGTRTHGALGHISELNRLEELSLLVIEATNGGPVRLQNRQVPDGALAHIARLMRLQVLSLDRTRITDAGLACLDGLTQLKLLSLSGTRVSDVGLVHLARLSRLEHLYLGGALVTDAGLASLARLNRLESLWLDGTQVTDAGLVHLAALSQLRRLRLDCTKVTDAGLPHLARLTQLQRLWLHHTHVTDFGVKRLRKVLPDCGIEY